MIGLKLGELIQVTSWDHIAIVVRSIKEALPWLHALEWQGGDWIHNEPERGRNLTVLTHSRYKIRLEVLEPSGKDSYLLPFLEKQERRQQEGKERFQHHITYYVKDLKKAIKVLEEKGFRLHFDRPGEFFIHMESAGTLIQFFQKRPWWMMPVWRGRFLWRRYGNLFLFALVVLDVAEFFVRHLRKPVD